MTRGVLPVTRYRTIVADPPWEYPEGFAGGHNSRANGQRTPVVTVALPYVAMSVEAIRALDVPAAADARLFLWTTNRYLPDAFGIVEAWGFRYRQMLVWHKTDANLASHVAPNAEFVLVATRGAPPRIGTMPSAVLTTARGKRHSAKPEAFLDLVEQVSPGPYLELFARRQRLGWDTWGNEALEHVQIPT